jgi:hypothetical protein
MDIEIIARVAHEANRALCGAIGDDSQVPWADAPGWQRTAAIEGIEFALANPDATAESRHEAWSAAKLADGWTFGAAKDAEKKTHPQLVPYDELSREQQAKDKLFGAIVAALKS